MIFLTGTNGQNWRPIADQLSAADPRKIAVVGASSSKDFRELLRGQPRAELIIFAEEPASLMAEGAASPNAILDGWKTCAASFLALWRKNRQRVTIINWNECLSDTAAFSKWLADRPGIKMGKAALKLPSCKASPASVVLAGVIVAQDREATRLWNELQAASQPVAKDAPLLAPPSPLLALKELSRNEQQLAAERDDLATRLDSLQSEHSSLSTRHSSLVTSQESLVAERDALATQLAQVQQHAVKTHEMLLQEIQNAHKESEDFFEQLEIARADAEATRQELASVRAAHDADRQELARTAGSLQQTEASKQEAESHQRVLQDELSALQAESQSLKESTLRNHEMLLQEIQNAHKESESFFEQWKSLEASVQPHYLVAERILRGGEKHHPPHSHLDYVFESASLFERHWRRLPVRLVEHHGNAGLAIFNPYGNGTNPLYHWKPDGQESGLDFMLFVPSDKNATDKLVGVPASDLLLVRDATVKILGHLSVHEGPEAERWEPIARRLLQEIEEIPERLHYDSVAGFVNGEVKRPSIRFNAANLYFRGNCARAFIIDWTPATSGGTIRLEPNKANTPLLLSSASEVVVGFDSNEEEESVRKLWRSLTERDRTFLLLLAKAIPDFVFHLCEQHPDQKANKERLTKQARKLYRRLRNLDQRPRFRSAIAQLVRR
jgi:hypothetical protein